MNRLLQHYSVDVQFPQVSGAEHLEMLQIRDRLSEIESTLSPEERKALSEADARLAQQAAAFYAELSRFINLAEQREEHNIPPTRWWWYLDVLAQVPIDLTTVPTTATPQPELAA